MQLPLLRKKFIRMFEIVSRRLHAIAAILSILLIYGVPLILFGVGGTAFFSDTFTGADSTLLDAHTPDTGTSWTKVYNIAASTCSNVSTLGITRNALVDICQDIATAGAAYVANATYPSADYQVKYTCSDCGAVDEYVYGIIRGQDALDAANGGYVFYDATEDSIDDPILARITGSGTCSALETIDAGQIVTAFGPNNTVFTMQALGSEIAVFRDNVAYHVVTDTNIPTGKGGIGMGGLPCVPDGDLGGGQQIDNFQVLQIASASTTYNFPSTTGEVSNDWTNPTEAYDDNGTYAEEDDDGGAQDYGDFGFSVPAGSTIRGLQCAVELESGAASWVELGFEVSIDNGATWSSQLLVRNEPITPNVYLLGHANYLWGLTWASTDTADTDLRVRIEQNASESVLAGRDAEVDYIKCKVFYDEAAPVVEAAAVGKPRTLRFGTLILLFGKFIIF